MAEGKAKEIWLIAALVVVAVIFAVMSFTKEKAKPAPAAGVDVLADKVVPPAAGLIKPAHSESDQAAVADVKPVPAVVIPPREVLPKEKMAIQVYSFKDRTRADAAVEKLRTKGYKAYILESDLGDRGTWYRVRIGSFSSEEDVRKILDKVTSDFKTGIIVTE